MKFTLNNFNTNNFNDIICILLLITIGSIFFNGLSFIFVALVLFDYLIDKKQSSQKSIIVFNVIGLITIISTFSYLIYQS